MPTPTSQSRHSTRSFCYSHRCISFPDMQSGCLLQSAAPFHPCAPARVHLNQSHSGESLRCVVLHSPARFSGVLVARTFSTRSSAQPLPCSRDVPFSLTATRSSFCFFANYHSNHPSSSTYRLVSHWDYLMYGPALHTVITCATAPHSRKAQGCIRSATTQLSNVICGTDSRCRGRQ